MQQNYNMQQQLKTAVPTQNQRYFALQTQPVQNTQYYQQSTNTSSIQSTSPHQVQSNPLIPSGYRLPPPPQHAIVTVQQPNLIADTSPATSNQPFMNMIDSQQQQHLQYQSVSICSLLPWNMCGFTL